jgi:RNA polymerase sigma factor (sigma-70 family)
MSIAVWATVERPRAPRPGRPWAVWVEPSEVAGAVRRAAAGDQGAWAALVDDFTGLVWSVAAGHRLGPGDTAEVVQTTWLRLLENLGRIREPERLGGWLATTARRESLRLLRLRGREWPADAEQVLDREPAPGPTPEEAVLDRDRDRRLWRAFARLPERCQRLLRLVVVLRPPYTEVAAIMDIPVGSIGPTRQRCLDRLRRQLAEGGADGYVMA